MSKFILHIPCKKYVEGELVDNGYEKFIDAMVQKLTDIGVCGWYMLDAKGYYKSRMYDEKLMVIFYDGDEVTKAFIQTCRELDKELGQEVYAYEKNNELIVFDLEMEKKQ